MSFRERRGLVGVGYKGTRLGADEPKHAVFMYDVMKEQNVLVKTQVWRRCASYCGGEHGKSNLGRRKSGFSSRFVIPSDI